MRTLCVINLTNNALLSYILVHGCMYVTILVQKLNCVNPVCNKCVTIIALLSYMLVHGCMYVIAYMCVCCLCVCEWYLPSLRTKTKSLSITVWILWAIVSTVRFLNSWLMIFCITPVTESTEVVASSSTRMLLFFNKALPRQNICLWPTL